MTTSRDKVSLLLLGTSLILLVGFLRGDLGFEKYWRLKKSQEILDETVTKLKNENESMKLEIKRIQNSKSYAKKVLRDRYHITEKNESIIFYAE